MNKITLTAAICVMFLGGSAFAADALELAGKLPMESMADSQAVLGEIVKLGPAGIQALCQKLAAPGEGDVKAEFALNGLALHVIRPGAEAERKVVVAGLMAALQAEQRADVKPLLIQLLQACGKDEAVPALAAHLGQGPVLCDHAARALAGIATPAAIDALLKALPASKAACRSSVLNALGELARAGKLKALPKDAEAVVIADAGEADLKIHQPAWRLLAQAGSLDGAAGTLAKAAANPNANEAAVGTAEYLVFVRRLGAADKAKAAAICRELLAARRAPGNKAAAASALVDILAAEANADLLALADNPSLDIRTSALMLAAGLKGQAVTAAWAEKLAKASPAVRADIAWMLGKRGDAAAAPALAAALKSDDPALQAASIDALGRLAPQSDQAVAALIDALGNADKNVATHAQAVLARTAGESISKALAQAAGKAQGPAKAALIEILTARRSPETVKLVLEAAQDGSAATKAAAVKAMGELGDFSVAPKLVDLLMRTQDAGEQEAIQKSLVMVANRSPDPQQRAQSVLAVLDQADPAKKAILLRALGRVGGDKALAAVVAEAKKDASDVQDAAVRALVDWPDATAVPALTDLAKTAPKPAQQVLAVRGLTRIASAVAAQDAAKAVEVFAAALSVAPRDDDKRAILSALGNVKTPQALKLAASLVKDQTVSGEAAQAVAAIALPNPKKRGDKGLRGADVAQALRLAAEVCKDKALKDKMLKHAAAAQK
ncbi:MAG TPA: HEAT repeat domain-containing protein [Phycisphaerae bacterium]|nr:HEAT repeat domain-containing protein [Phycisphaerae bacterium]HQL73915.1 HEAT repeat domain-containing protein [Phycisphaerae bacterium]